MSESGPTPDWAPMFAILVMTENNATAAVSVIVPRGPVDCPSYSSPIRGRIRFMLSPYALIDLIAIFPFYLPILLGAQSGAERVLRIFRLFRLLKIVRYSSSLTVITNVFRRKAEELLITVLVMSIWLVFVSILMYYVERGAQPGVFTSIPAALW
ncbi:ion transporter [Natrinema sp. DC36]|uniref:ion transporter n=1 Tax=Natrinema sp. DC36 TaxID=2878680 RepID=UPI001CF005B8|nr:ion transporter [Natrinema sp. DC36]